MKNTIMDRKNINRRFLIASYVLSLIVTYIVYSTGGTKNVYTNLMYIPIAIISSTNGLKKGLIHAVYSGLLLGPLMPLNVELGQSQTVFNWIIRLVIYLLMAFIIGFFSDYSRKNREYILNLLTHDALTDLRNIESLKREENHDKKKKTIIALTVKNYEETLSIFGYDFINKSILTFSKKLNELLNQFENIEIIKYNGMEFILIVSHENNYINTDAIINSLEELNELTLKVNGIPIYIETLVGITNISENENVLEGVRQALVALRYAIINNKKRCFYYANLDTYYKNVVDIAANFKSTLALNKIRVAYQRIVKSESEDIFGVELLARWEDDSGNFLSPGIFIPVIENTELINELTAFMINKAIEFCSSNKDAIVSINFSPKAFNDENINYLINLIRENNIDFKKIKIEVTEEILLNKEKAIKYFNILKEHNMNIAMDDFGTGYSSYKSIGEVPIDIIKIDKSIVGKICESKLSRSIVESIVYFCRQNGLETVAEGVETREIAEICKEIGIDYLQGYYYHTPTIIE
jgi:EAL domain-containing protein (putative c-di-GMP-specific phosphodiesterase class I)/GGDEF domain-containing protein